MSQFSGHSQKIAWYVLNKTTTYCVLWKGAFIEDKIVSAENVICRLYCVTDADMCDKA